MILDFRKMRQALVLDDDGSFVGNEYFMSFDVGLY